MIIKDNIEDNVILEVEKFIKEIIPDFKMTEIVKGSDDIEIHGTSSIFAEEDKDHDNHKIMIQKTQEAEAVIEAKWDESWGVLTFSFIYIDGK